MATRFTVRLSHVVRSLCGPPGETCPHRNGRQANVGNPSSPNPGPFMLAMAHVSLKKEEEKKQQPFPIEASDFQEQEDMSCMGLRSQKEAGWLAFFCLNLSVARFTRARYACRIRSDRNVS